MKRLLKITFNIILGKATYVKSVCVTSRAVLSDPWENMTDLHYENYMDIHQMILTKIILLV